MRSTRQALTRLRRQVDLLGRTSGWDAAPRRGSVLGELANKGESARDAFERVFLLGHDENGEPIMDPEGVEQAARRLVIQSHELTQDAPWVPYDGQIEAWQWFADHSWVYVLKSRQVGITMAALLWDLVWTAARDARGNRVATALIWDSFDKAEEQIARAEALAFQLGLPLARAPTKRTIKLFSGSRIVARSANAKGATRGMSYQRYHCSEVPFWGRATEIWAAMRPSLNLGAPVLFETTMDVSVDPLAADTWKKPNRFAKLFLPFEHHREYKGDPASIPEHAWEWLRDDEGFTDRAAAAWWWDRLENEMNGDRHAAFREYPQLPRHAFSVAEGRFIRIEPKVTKPVETWTYTSSDGGRRFEVQVWRTPEESSAQIAIGIDVATGIGGDSSVIAVVDKKDRAIVALLADNWLERLDLARIAVDVQGRYMRERDYRANELNQYWLPDVDTDMETNGVGEYCFGEFRRLGGRGRAYKTGSSESGTRINTLLESRRWVEAGACYGPEALELEARKLVRNFTADGKDKGWTGHDDVLMALGMALRRVKVSPYVEPPSVQDAERAQHEEMLRRIQELEDGTTGRGL